MEQRKRKGIPTALVSKKPVSSFEIYKYRNNDWVYTKNHKSPEYSGVFRVDFMQLRSYQNKGLIVV